MMNVFSTEFEAMTKHLVHESMTFLLYNLDHGQNVGCRPLMLDFGSFPVGGMYF